MIKPKKTYESTLENVKVVKKIQKEDVNINNNSSLYFQIGLILCLLVTYSLLEMRFETNDNISKHALDDITEEPIDFIDKPVKAFKVYKPEVEEIQKKKRSTIIEDPIIVKDDSPDIEETLDLVKESSNEPMTPDDMSPIIEAPTEANVAFVSVETIPVYPGCEKYKKNSEKRRCMSEKIQKLIKRKFNIELVKEFNLKKKQVIETQFTIDKNGYVTNIKTVSKITHPILKEEAARAINQIPKMTPGKQRGKNVGVIYSLPIKINFSTK